MAWYVMLSRFRPGALDSPEDFKELAHKVSARIKSDCPGVKWKSSYVTLGRYDVVDVFEAQEPHEATRAALIVTSLGRVETETMVATPWQEFLDKL